MALSSSVIYALKLLKPDSINSVFLSFFEYLKYDSDEIRTQRIILKENILEQFKKSDRQKIKTLPKSLSEDFDELVKILSKLQLLEDDGDVLQNIKWDKIIDICNILRKIESSDEKKVRWGLLYLLSHDKDEININELKLLLKNFKLTNIDKILQKIIKIESNSGLMITTDNNKIKFETEHKITEHYVADAIEEKSRRSPGEIEKDILELLDEGSYSNQEISRILELDEAVVSRAMTKLRNQNKLVLSNFGTKGFRYYTTNCQNCPFGKTVSSCRKDAISYIVSAFKEAYDVELTSQHFDDVESNQALLSIKRITKMSKKYSMTKLESNLYENYEKLLQIVIKNSTNQKTINSGNNDKIAVLPNLSKLPKIFQIGFKSGMQYEVQLMKKMLNDPKKKQSDFGSFLSKLIQDSNKMLQLFGH